MLEMWLCAEHRIHASAQAARECPGHARDEEPDEDALEREFEIPAGDEQEAGWDEEPDRYDDFEREFEWPVDVD
jgi:hypothetical protein